MTPQILFVHSSPSLTYIFNQVPLICTNSAGQKTHQTNFFKVVKCFRMAIHEEPDELNKLKTILKFSGSGICGLDWIFYYLKEEK